MFEFIEYLMDLDKQIFILYSIYFLLTLIVVSVIIELIVKETYKFISFLFKKVFGINKKVL